MKFQRNNSLRDSQIKSNNLNRSLKVKDKCNVLTVFPDPVTAQAMTSLPFEITGIAHF